MVTNKNLSKNLIRFLSILLLILILPLSCEKLNEYNTNVAPVAILNVDPAMGNTRTDFEFDPTESVDKESLSESLQARWDWEGDGTWDTDYGSLVKKNHRFLNEGIFNVKLEVKDPEGLTGQASEEVVVSQSYSSEYVITFWTKSDQQIMVFVNQEHIGTITKSYDSSPSCNAEGCVTYESSVPDIVYSAETTDGRSKWSEKTYTINTGCTKFHLRITSDSDEATEIIGSNGGSITHKGLTITVPEGSFKEENEIKISTTDSPDEMFNHTPGEDIFQIEGLPQNFGSAIKVNLTKPENADENTYISLGEATFSKSLNEERISSRLLDTELTQENLVAYIQPFIGGFSQVLQKGLKFDEYENLYISSVEEMLYFSSNRFKIYYEREADAGFVANLNDYLMDAYEIVENDFKFDLSRRTYWPLEVYVEDLPNKVDGLFTRSFFWFFGDYMQFNLKHISDVELMKTTAMHEFFHFAQDLYDPHENEEHFWFDEACSSWSQAIASTHYVAVGEMEQNNQESLYGPDNIVISGWQKHGYGMAYFVEYLSNKMGKDQLVNIYESIADEVHIIKAIDDQLSGDASVWWKDYMSEYLSGDIFGMVPTDFINSNSCIKLNINNESDFLQIQSGYLNDLGTALYTLDLNYDYADDAKLEFTLAGLGTEGNITAYKYKQGTYFTQIGDQPESLTITNVKELKDQGYTLLFAVTNLRNVFPYTKTTNFQLEVRLEELGPIDYYKAKYVSVNCKVLATFIGREEGTYDYEFGASGPGSYNGTKFIVDEEDAFEDMKNYISLSIDTDTDTDTDIISRGMTESHNSEGMITGVGETYRLWGLSWGTKLEINSIGISDRTMNTITFAVYGSTVGEFINSIDFKSDEERKEGYGELIKTTKELKSFRTNADSYLIVSFSWED